MVSHPAGSLVRFPDANLDACERVAAIAACCAAAIELMDSITVGFQTEGREMLRRVGQSASEALELSGKDIGGVEVIVRRRS